MIEENQNAIQAVDFTAAVETAVLSIQIMSHRDQYAQIGTWGQPRKQKSVNMFCKQVFQHTAQIESNFTKVEILQLFKGKLSSEMSYFFTEDS